LEPFVHDSGNSPGLVGVLAITGSDTDGGNNL